MIVMGIYRLLDVLIRQDPTVAVNQIPGGHKRIVICYPPYNYNMDPSDMVYVMQQSRPYNYQYSRENSLSLPQTR